MHTNQSNVNQFHVSFFNKERLLQAVQYGQIRTHNSRGLRDNWGLRNTNALEDARRQTVGTLGEMALADAFRLPYVFTVNTFKAPDIVVGGMGLQAKASEKAEYLTIRRDAKDNEPYVLVHIDMPEGDPRAWTSGEAYGTILGWMYPWQARLIADVKPEYWRDPGRRNAPAIFIPAAELLTLEDLYSEVATVGSITFSQRSDGSGA